MTSVGAGKGAVEGGADGVLECPVTFGAVAAAAALEDESSNATVRPDEEVLLVGMD